MNQKGPQDIISKKIQHGSRSIQEATLTSLSRVASASDVFGIKIEL